jgi:hypothetical protein
MQSTAQPERVAKLDPGVVSSTLPNGEIVLLHLDTRKYYSLNRTGAIVWKLIECSTPLVDISQALFDQFDVTPESAGETVRDLMQELKTHKLITFTESESRTQNS